MFQPQYQYEGMYYGCPQFASMVRPTQYRSQAVLPPLALGRDMIPAAAAGQEEQKMGEGMAKPYGVGHFTPMMMPFPKDCVHFVAPNIININNVNTLGTALIINNSVQTRPAETPQKPLGRETLFRVEVDQDYYRKLYAGHPALKA